MSLGSPFPGNMDPDDLLAEAAGHGRTYVNAAFCQSRATGNRFNGPERGAWYASCRETAIEAAQTEVAWHLTCAPKATGVSENTAPYREHLSDPNPT